MSVKQKILVLAGERAIRGALLLLISNSDRVEACADGNAAAILLGCGSRLEPRNVVAAQALARERGGVPVVLVTTEGSEALAVEAMRAGISNYFRMPETARGLDELLAGIPNAAERGHTMDRIIGESQTIRDLKSYLERAAACSSNVLITGETGCGKEMVAELIHEYSPRSSRPFITVNCAAIPDSLLESELFGFERGAFTGAHAAQEGKLRLAHGGTVFLDEIGDLTQYAQAKLLRAIESGEIQRLGGGRAQKIDVRVVAATNRDLESDAGFRKDLFFRLNVARIHLPPLRDRKQDILTLAEAFRKEFDGKFGRRTAGFAAAARATLLAHNWPGNIRELRNAIEAAFIDLPANAREIELPLQFTRAVETRATKEPGELERILQALDETQWNKSRAAERLEWSRMTLYRKLAQYRIVKASA